jgi:tetratricopeptide (TPR) repeat protein
VRVGRIGGVGPEKENPVKKLVTGWALLALILGSATAHARNFHIAGGIQYVVQGLKEKEKGNLEDANRIFGKAVRELTIGTTEDPKDGEAFGYLGWAYAELDSAEKAGAAFDQAMVKLANDPKKLKQVSDNREHYWVVYYNAGLQRYKDADQIVPLKDLLGSTDPKAADARAKLEQSAIEFRKAIAILPSKAEAYNNMAVVLALQGRFDDAAAVVDQGLKVDPENENLKARKDSMYNNVVVKLLEEGKYDEAVAQLEKSLERNPTDYGLLGRIAQTSYEHGQKLDEKKDATGAKTAYDKAVVYFGRAAEQAPADSLKRDMRYNQAVAAQAGGDVQTAAKVLFDLVQEHPKDATLHKMLRGSYEKLGQKKKADEQIWVVLGMADNSSPVADVAAYTSTVGKASDAGKTLAAQGAPEEVRQFASGETKVDVWYYWQKKRVYAFSGGRQVGTANFGEFPTEAPATAPAASGAKKG